MALLIRKTDTAKFVHAEDLALPTDFAGRRVVPNSQWFHTAGAPPGCTVVEVRGLNADEFNRIQALQKVLAAAESGSDDLSAASIEWRDALVAVGLAAIDGAPVAAAELPEPILYAIAALVSDLANLPFLGRASKSAA